MSNLMGENAMPTPEAAFEWAAADTATAAAGASATITYTLTAGQQLYLAALMYSFSAAVTAGRLTITDDGNTVMDLDLGTAAGNWDKQFAKVRKSSVGKTIVITLATGGGTGVPKLNAISKVVNNA